MPLTATPVSHGPGTGTGRRGSSPFQVVMRRPILAAVELSCGPEVFECPSQSPVVSPCPCEWLRFSGFADIPKLDGRRWQVGRVAGWQGGRVAGIDFPTREGKGLVKNTRLYTDHLDCSRFHGDASHSTSDDPGAPGYFSPPAQQLPGRVRHLQQERRLDLAPSRTPHAVTLGARSPSRTEAGREARPLT